MDRVTKKQPYGFSVVGVVLALVVIFLMGLIGWLVSNRHHQNNQPVTPQGSRVDYTGTVESINLSPMKTDGDGIFVVKTTGTTGRQIKVYLGSGESACDKTAIATIPSIKPGDNVIVSGVEANNGVIRVCERGTYIKAQNNGAASPVNFKKLSISSAPSNGHDVKSQLINDQMVLEDVWKELYGTDTSPILPAVDFKTSTLVLITNSASSGGYAISLKSVTEGSNNISINYTAIKPGSSCVVTESFVLNYELATIPVTNKTASFNPSDKIDNC